MKDRGSVIPVVLLIALIMVIATFTVMVFVGELTETTETQADASAGSESFVLEDDSSVHDFESSMVKEETSSASEPEPEPETEDASEPETESMPEPEDVSETAAEETTQYGPVSGGVPASPLAAEDDPYPGLYVDHQEKTDDSTQKIVYLTFDDGPSDNTDRILDVLKQENVKATFFVSAQFGTKEERAQRMRRILEEGHTLGLHTYSHDYGKIYASIDAFLSDLNEINEEVYAATGYQADLIRFPGGSANSHNRNICERLSKEVTRRGYTFHDWGVSCGDPEGEELSVYQILRKTLEVCEGQEKTEVLFYDTPVQNSTVDALDELIQVLRSDGYELRALDGTIRPIQYIKVES